MRTYRVRGGSLPLYTHNRQALNREPVRTESERFNTPVWTRAPSHTAKYFSRIKQALSDRQHCRTDINHISHIANLITVRSRHGARGGG